MDAHLFRMFAENASLFLNGSLIEKIREPHPGLLGLEVYNHGEKKQLLFHSGKQKPFCFFSSVKLPVVGHPSAPVMRLRKYFMEKRAATVIFQPWQRKLWIMAGGQGMDKGKNPWLCLDLAKGWSIHFLDNENIPQEETTVWPTRENLVSALQDWQKWPTLTPALRKTLKHMELPEQLALLNDLEAGGGDIFIYKTGDRVEAISAWPLAGSLNQKEEIYSNALEAFEVAGNNLVLENLWQKRTSELEDRAQKKIHHLERLLENLEKDEKNLLAMTAREIDALAIQGELWNIDKDEKKSSFQTPAGMNIILNGKYTILDNMVRMFNQATRGKRGLRILRERKEQLERELAEYKSGKKPEEETIANERQRKSPVSINKILPKNVAAFRSGDGFVILRGKDARGNQAVRKLAHPHDLWVHVEKGQGAHVIIRKTWPGQEVPERTLEEAGSLAASKSWLAKADQAAIMYAEARHVKPMRKGAPGMVTIDRVAFTRMAPVDPDLELKLGE